jgi:predicted Zn-dependent protease with MMP-like domain
MNDETLDAELDRAWELFERGDEVGARRLGEKLRRLAPAVADIPVLLAACAREAGQDGRALALLREASDLDPDWAEPDLRAADLLAADPARRTEALSLAGRALSKAEEEEEVLDALALKAGIELDLERPDAARATLGGLPASGAAEAPPEVAREIAHLFVAIGQAATARRWFERLVQRHPLDAEGWHGLGVSAEAMGDESGKRRAWLETLTLDASQDTGASERLTENEVAEEAERALEELPPRARALLENVPVLIADQPSREDVATGLDPRLLGLFVGTAYPEMSAVGGGPQLTQILLFRRNLERVAESEEQLRDEIRTTLLHETGHFFGMSEEDLDEVGLG